MSIFDEKNDLYNKEIYLNELMTIINDQRFWDSVAIAETNDKPQISWNEIANKYVIDVLKNLSFKSYFKNIVDDRDRIEFFYNVVKFAGEIRTNENLSWADEYQVKGFFNIIEKILKLENLSFTEKAKHCYELGDRKEGSEVKETKQETLNENEDYGMIISE